METGIDPHRHADRQREGRRDKAQLEGGRHLFQDDLPDRPRLLIGEAEFAARRTVNKSCKLNDKGVVDPELLPQPLAVGEAGILSDHIVDRVADIIEQRESNQPDGEHHQNGLIETLNEKGDHRPGTNLTISASHSATGSHCCPLAPNRQCPGWPILPSADAAEGTQNPL